MINKLLEELNSDCEGFKLSVEDFNKYFLNKTKSKINISCWDNITVLNYDNKEYIYNGLINNYDIEIYFKVIDNSDLNINSKIEINNIQ